MSNLLVLGGGRRLPFLKQMKSFGYNLFMYELSADNPVSYQLNCPTIIGRKWESEDIKEHLEQVINEWEIDLILPMDCNAVYQLSKLQLQQAICSSGVTSGLCFDKAAMKMFFASNENICKYYPFALRGFEWISKPRFGFGSSGIEIHEAGDLHPIHHKVSQYRLTGKEYSVDCYFSRFSNKLVNICVRERTRVCGPEVVESVTVNRPDIAEAVLNISNEIKFTGPICFQFIDNETGKPFLTEINARVGGGTSLSLEAGLNIPYYIMAEYISGIPITRTEKSAVGVKMIRAYTDSYFRG